MQVLQGFKFKNRKESQENFSQNPLRRPTQIHGLTPFHKQFFPTPCYVPPTMLSANSLIQLENENVQRP